MRTALTDALRNRNGWVATLACKPATAHALADRGLAEDTDEGFLLTSAGILAAARLNDDHTRPLAPGDVVIYHGSYGREHGEEFVVTACEDGRYVLVDTYNGSCTLRQVRRGSVSWTGHRMTLAEES
jgi:hypothetical protein